ncbi:unnamed protein product [Polarella glacialis]|uniref:Uncharacterized protein n=1 Tax=Polarella glacialis TaxID=89957 RepID=A0A813K1N6_POLGL|nr:unnamed protein product [Polarella glacialis]
MMVLFMCLLFVCMFVGLLACLVAGLLRRSLSVCSSGGVLLGLLFVRLCDTIRPDERGHKPRCCKVQIVFVVVLVVFYGCCCIWGPEQSAVVELYDRAQMLLIAWSAFLLSSYQHYCVIEVNLALLSFTSKYYLVLLCFCCIAFSIVWSQLLCMIS